MSPIPNKYCEQQKEKKRMKEKTLLEHFHYTNVKEQQR